MLQEYYMLHLLPHTLGGTPKKLKRVSLESHHQHKKDQIKFLQLQLKANIVLILIDILAIGKKLP